MKKQNGQVRKLICVLITAGMLLSDTGVTGFAAEAAEPEVWTQNFTEEAVAEESFIAEPEQEKASGAKESETDAEKTGSLEERTENSDVTAESVSDTSGEGDVAVSMEEISTEEACSVEMPSEEMIEETAMDLQFSEDDIAHGQYENITWVIDASGKLTVEGTGNCFTGNNGLGKAPWYEQRSKIKTAEVRVQGMTTASGLFYECDNLTQVDLSGLDMSNVSNIGSLFSGCVSLERLDFDSRFDTSKVTSMRMMFYGCSSLKKLNLEVFDTGMVTDMYGMFGSCESLEELVLGSNFRTDNVTNMYSMFSYCSSLTSVDVSKFETGKVTDMSYLFYGCSSLTSLDVSKFDTGKVTDMLHMFSGCRSLTSLDVSKFDTQRVTNMSYLFNECEGLQSIDVSGFDTSNVTDMSYMFYRCSSIQSIDVSRFHTSKVTNMAGMFGFCYGLSSLDVSSFETDKVTSMAEMFAYCSGLSSLDLSHFNTKEVTNMSEMFACYADLDCGKGGDGKGGELSQLANLNISSFDTHNVTDMSGMFRGCRNLSALEAVKNFDTSQVTDMSTMFQDCHGLSELDLSNFDTSQVTNMGGMFQDCDFTNLDLSNFDTNNVTDMGQMFFLCDKLVGVHVDGFHTDKVTSMSEMFSECRSLKSLNVSSFDTENVQSIYHMFFGCSSLESLDLSSFKITITEENSEEYVVPFGGNTKLSVIYTPYSTASDIVLESGGGDWYDAAGNTYPDRIPTTITQSIMIKKGETPTVSSAHITAVKAVTSYACGDNINTDDLTVRYYGSDGTVTELKSGYSTNVSQIDTSTPGTKQMKVTYNGLTATINLHMTYALRYPEITVTLPDEGAFNYTYDGQPKRPVPTVTYAVRENEAVTLTQGEDYTVVYYNNVDAFEYTEDSQNTEKGPTVFIKGKNNYKGSVSKYFSIHSVDCTVRFDMQGHGSNLADVTVRKGGKLTEPTEPTAEGYTFGGWYKEAACTTAWNFATNTVTADTTLYAKWTQTTEGGDPGDDNPPTPTKYTVTFNMQNHGAAIASQTVNKGGKLTEPTEPTAEGYTFGGWYKEAACTTAWNFATDTVTADTTLYAKWTQTTEGGDPGDDNPPTPTQYTVTFNMQNHGAAIASQTVNKGGKLTEPTEPTAEGYTFGGWYKEAACTTAWNFATDTVTENITLYAKWTQKTSGDNDTSDATDLNTVNPVLSKIKGKIYDGTPYEPAMKVTVKENGKNVVLVEGYDYKVSYENNEDAGTGKVIIEGVGSYTGKLETTFEITPKQIKRLKIVTGGVAKNASFTGLSALPLYVYDGTKCLACSSDYTLSDYNAGKVSVSGKGNYTGSVTAKFTVLDADADKILQRENVADIAPVTYTGKALKPEPTVTVGQNPLTKNKDYKVQYQNNKDAGTAYMIVTGKGEYKGKVVVPFVITPLTSDLTIAPVAAKTYNGKLQKPTVTVKDQNNKKLKKNKDYIVSYEENLHAGTATVIVTGKGNYKGMEAKTTFVINPQKMSKASVKGTRNNLAVTYNKKTLREGIHFETPSYNESTLKKNKIQVTLTGKGNFTGTVTKTVKVQ